MYAFLFNRFDFIVYHRIQGCIHYPDSVAKCFVCRKKFCNRNHLVQTENILQQKLVFIGQIQVGHSLFSLFASIWFLNGKLFPLQDVRNTPLSWVMFIKHQMGENRLKQERPMITIVFCCNMFLKRFLFHALMNTILLKIT